MGRKIIQQRLNCMLDANPVVGVMDVAMAYGKNVDPHKVVIVDLPKALYKIEATLSTTNTEIVIKSKVNCSGRLLVGDFSRSILPNTHTLETTPEMFLFSYGGYLDENMTITLKMEKIKCQNQTKSSSKSLKGVLHSSAASPKASKSSSKTTTSAKISQTPKTKKAPMSNSRSRPRTGSRVIKS